MSKLGISTGSIPNDNTGDSLILGATKVNSNFNEIYNYFGNGTNLTCGVWNKTASGINTLSDVSVGTATPVSKFTVSGDSFFSGITTFSGQLEVRGSVGNVENYAGFGDANLNRLLIGYKPNGQAGTTNSAAISADNTGSIILGTRSSVANSIIFATSTGTGAAAEVGRWDSSGRLLVGTSSTISGGFNDNGTNSQSAVPQIQVAGNDWAKASATFATYQNAAGVFSQISFNKSRSGTVGTIGAALSSGEAIGGFQFAGSDSAKFLSCAAIEAYADGAFSLNNAPGRIVFKTISSGANLTERMRLDSSGRLLVGTSTNTNNIRLNQSFAVVSAGNPTYGGASLTNYGGATFTASPVLDLNRSRGTTDGSMTKVESGDRLGVISFRGSDGSAFLDGAAIEAYADAATSTNDLPTRLVFSTTADGAASFTERMRITNAGLVGIGTGSPLTTLHCAINSSSTSIATAPGTAFFQNLNATSGAINSLGFVNSGGFASASVYTVQTQTGNSGDNLVLTTKTSGGSWNTGVVIDTFGRLLVGTSTARNNLFNSVNTYGGLFQVEGAGQFGGTRGAAVITNNSSIAGAFPYLVLAKANGDSIGSTTIVSNGNTVGMLSFQGSDGSEFVEAANIYAEVDGTPGANDMPGRLVFSTTADGAASPTEAMRINNQRELLIGTTTRTANGGVLQVSNGITFPGTQSACSDPNTLDDYEEGTWTVTLYDAATGGNASTTTTTGDYTKVGNTVRATFSIDNINTTGLTAANVLYFTLPFTHAATYESTGSCASSLVTFGAGYTNLNSFIVSSTTRGYFIASGTNIAFGNAPVSWFNDDAADLRVTIIYKAA